jgi:hypothetical protein
MIRPLRSGLFSRIKSNVDVNKDMAENAKFVKSYHVTTVRY